MSREPTVFMLHSSVDPVRPMATRLNWFRRLLRKRTGVNLATLRMLRGLKRDRA